MADNKVNFLRGTSAEYEATTKDNDTFYYTTDTKKLYLGETEITGIEIDDTSTIATDKTWSAKKISDSIPTELPADGGNADTVDGLHANEIASNRNLLDNPDFRINQRGASGTITIAGYFVDRWKLDSGEVTVNADGTLTLNGTISQTLENAVGVSVTASSGAGTASYDDSTRTFTLTASGEAISWAKLEVGANATPFVPPNAADELAKCQRYFNSLFMNGIPVKFIGSGIAVNNNMATILVNLPTVMRSSAPTVSLTGTLYLSDGSHNAENSIAMQGIAGSHLNRNVLQLNLTSGSTLDRTATYLLSRRDKDTTLMVSAEL